ncbi:MAG: Gfo/Idh/MocA family oxidoreductase [Bryobacteraceae bacterium]|nr:Gfo/Idh/MocA family oxidoreductase [Bryobacteraceae bacterium]
MQRRSFVGAAGAAAFSILRPELVRGTQRNSAVRLALFGCGGRGTGVAASFLANTDAVVTALGDLFEGQLARAKDRLDTAAAKAGKPPIDRSQLFAGPDSLDRLLESKAVDAVQIATPPYFHPEQLAKVVAAGKHVYCEKPVAVDVAGCLSVIESGKKAQGRLSLAIGFQLRHAPPYVEIRERIRNGQIGEVICGLSHYYAGAIRRPDWPDASPQERRLRNWIHDRVLSGDIFVEQNIHLVDLNNWLLGARPLSAQGVCGRRGRRDQGDCSSHYNVTFTYPNDVHITVTSTQFIEGEWDVGVRLFGTEGNAELRYDAPVRITGRRPWDAPGVGKPEKTGAEAAVTGAFKGAIEDADAEKEKHWIASIASGNFLNEAEQGAESTLSAILGRTAAYTGRAWTFDEVVRSGERWDAGLDVRRL